MYESREWYLLGIRSFVSGEAPYRSSMYLEDNKETCD